jgi:SAM-dependent methyltransferase
MARSPDRGPAFTSEELANMAVFSSETARAQYRVYHLTPRERMLVERYFTRRGARVLDLGCGYGRTTVPLHDMGYRVIGTDIVGRMIAEARQAYPHIVWALMSATDLALDSGSVDYVLFSANGLDCIYPRARRDRALREMHRVLRPGGCLVYSSHNWLAQVVTSVWNPDRRADLWRNVRRGRLRPGYLRIPQGEGELTLHYGWPGAEARRLARLGFRDVRVHGGKISPRLERYGRLAGMLIDAWPHYVAFREP